MLKYLIISILMTTRPLYTKTAIRMTPRNRMYTYEQMTMLLPLNYTVKMLLYTLIPRGFS